MSPAHREVSLPAIFGYLVNVLVLTERVEDGVDLRVGVAIAHQLHGGAGDAEAVQHLRGEGRGNHLSVGGRGGNVAVAGVVAPEHVVGQAEVVVQIDVHQVSQGISKIAQKQ